MLSSVLIKLGFFLKEKARFDAVRQASMRQQAVDGAALQENLSSFQSQSPLAAADLADRGLLNTRKAA